MARKFFTKDVQISDVPNSTADNCVVFPQYLPHRFNEHLAAEGESTFKPLIKSTEATLGGRKAVEPTEFPPLAEYELTNSLLPPEAVTYMQTLFYVTGGSIPFVAPDVLASGSTSTQQLVSFAGDLVINIEQTNYAHTYDNKGNKVFTEANFFGVVTDSFDYTAATVNSRATQLHSIEDSIHKEVLSNEWATGLILIENAVEIDAFEEGAFPPERRLAVVNNSTANLEVQVHVPGVTPFSGGPELTRTFTRSYPTSTYRQGVLASNLNTLFYTFGTIGTINLIDIFAGVARESPIPAPYTMVTDVSPLSVYGMPGFIFTAITPGSGGGILGFQPAKGDAFILETFTSLIPTALLVSRKQEIILAFANGSLTLSLGIYTLENGFQRLPDQVISAPGQPTSWAIGKLFIVGRQVFGALVVPTASASYIPAVINLFTGEVIGNTNVGAFGAGSISVQNPTASNNYFVNVTKGPDGVYIHVPANANTPSSTFVQTADRVVPHTTNYQPASNLQVVENLLQLKLIEPGRYDLANVRVTSQSVTTTSSRHVILGLSEFLGTPHIGMTGGGIAGLIAPLNQHQSVVSIKGIRTNTRKPYTSPFLNILDTGLGANVGRINYANRAYTITFPTDSSIVTQGIIDFIVRDDDVFAVESYYHSDGPNPRVQSRILRPSSVASGSGNTFFHGFVPSGHGAIASPTLGETYLYWNDTALNITPAKLNAEISLNKAQELPSTVYFGQNLVAFDVGIKTFMKNLDGDIRAVEFWNPTIEMDSIELNGELDTSNVTVRGHRFYESNHGEYAIQALGGIESVTPYAPNIRADVDVLWAIGNTPVDPDLSVPCVPSFQNLVISNSSPDPQGVPDVIKLNPVGYEANQPGATFSGANMGTDFVQFGGFGTADGFPIPAGSRKAALFNELSLFRYSPQTQGPLDMSTVQLAVKWAYTDGPGPALALTGSTDAYFAIRQNNTVYIYQTPMASNAEATGEDAPEEFYGTAATVGGTPMDNTVTRATFELETGWHKLISGLDNTPIWDLDTNVHPNFSSTGADITFGIAWNHARSQGGTSTQQSAIHQFTFSEFIIDFLGQTDSAKFLLNDAVVLPNSASLPAPPDFVNTGSGTFTFSEGNSGLFLLRAEPFINEFYDGVIQQKGNELFITAVPAGDSVFVQWDETTVREGTDLTNPVLLYCPDPPESSQTFVVGPTAIFDGPIVFDGGGT